MDNQDEKIDFLRNQKRQELIKAALIQLKELNKKFLSSYEATSEWIRINQGMLTHHVQVPLKTLVQLKLCQATSPEESYFNPFEKSPITLCYNKINKASKFNKLLTFNLIMHYDSATKREMNWNNLESTILTTTRALSISGICPKNDKICFQEEIRKRVLEKERFRGKQVKDLDNLIDRGLADSSPMSQILHQK